MKKKINLIVVALLLCASFSGYSQMPGGLECFGKSIPEIKKLYSDAPCEVTPNTVLTYCVTDGSRMSYVFENNKVKGIMFLTIQLNRYSAERALEKEIESFSKENNITPFYNKGQAIFSKEGVPISVSFGIGEFGGNVYLIRYTMLNPF